MLNLFQGLTFSVTLNLFQGLIMEMHKLIVGENEPQSAPLLSSFSVAHPTGCANWESKTRTILKLIGWPEKRPFIVILKSSPHRNCYIQDPENYCAAGLIKITSTPLEMPEKRGKAN